MLKTLPDRTYRKNIEGNIFAIKIQILGLYPLLWQVKGSLITLTRLNFGGNENEVKLYISFIL